jgi:uncharacterized protein
LVPITALRRTIGSQRREHREGRIGELSVAGSVVPDDADVVVDVVLGSISGGVEVAGTVSAPWRSECRRCLRDVDGRITATVRELYRPGGDGVPDEDTYELGTDYLDLQPLVRDALLLELPLAPLCQPDCAGLCPVCGADRNVTECDCRTDTIDPRWAALEVLQPNPPSAQ